MGRLACTLVLAAGCGRYGFATDEGAPDASTTTDAMPAQLACAQPAHVTLGNADALATVAMTGGVALFTAAGGQVHGWSYGIDQSGALSANATNKSIADNPTGMFAAASTGSRVLVAALADMPATRTTVSVLDSALGSIATKTRSDIATAVAPAPGGWAYVTSESGELHGQLLDPNLVDVGARVVLTANEWPSEPVMIATPTGYALAYVRTMGSPHVASLLALDTTLNKVHATTAGCPDDAEHAQVSFAAQSQRYLLTYMDKEPGDTIYAVELDATLQVVAGPIQLAKSAYVPKVGTDGTNFYLAWTDQFTDTLQGTRFDPSGAHTALTYEGGGNPAQWSLVTNDGQALIAWRTDDAAGDVTIAAICN